MSFLGIIIGVIVFVLYVAKSVEKQNEEERKRQTQRQGRRPVSTTRPVVDMPAEPGPNKKPPSPPSTARKASPAIRTIEEMNDQWQKKYQEAKERRKQQADAPAIAAVRVAADSQAAKKTAWMNDRQMVRRSFLFSECIGKPRAISPHLYFKKKG